MRVMVIAAACVLLAGCAEYLDISPDSFEHAPQNQEKFTVDSRACEDKADAERSYSVHGIEANEGERHRIYDRAYAACMTADGYKRRTDWYDFWEGYDW